MTEKTNFEQKSAERDGFEAVRLEILSIALTLVPFEGWTDAVLTQSARQAYIKVAVSKAAFPNGVRDLLQYWSSRLDDQMREAIEADAFQALKVREKVTQALIIRLEALSDHKEAARRGAAFLALPQNAPLGTKLLWKTSDAVWRGLGDPSTDFNYYSKRTILSGVWSSVFMRWLADETSEMTQTRAFLDARIENVMQIEKVKAKAREMGFHPKRAIQFLAGLRYPQQNNS